MECRPSRISDESIKCAFRRILPFLRLAVCTLIFFAAVAVLLAMTQQVAAMYRNLFTGQSRLLLHAAALLLVLLKALRILVSYLVTYHVRLHHIVEIAVIASVLEIVFAYDRHSIAVDILFASFAIVNLLILVFFYDTFARMNIDPENGEEIKREEMLERDV